jgi:hypothetical protein
MRAPSSEDALFRLDEVAEFGGIAAGIWMKSLGSLAVGASHVVSGEIRLEAEHREGR